MSKKTFAVIVGIISFIYLINPGAGVFELIPDNIPLIGNLDEGAATILLVSALRYFGHDLIGVLTKYTKITNNK